MSLITHLLIKSYYYFLQFKNLIKCDRTERSHWEHFLEYRRSVVTALIMSVWGNDLQRYTTEQRMAFIKQYYQNTGWVRQKFQALLVQRENKDVNNVYFQ